MTPQLMDEMDQSPPYLPKTWALGGRPEKSVDIPITAVFLALFVVSAATHMTIFQINRRRNHKFIFSAVLFGFSMARIVTCSLRIASTCIPANTRLAIAASIFVGAGVLILFIVNLIWAQRVLRALHPNIGWHGAISIAYRVLYAMIFFTFVGVITTIVQSFYTRRPRTLFIDRAYQLYGQTLLATVATLPVIIVLVALAIPRRKAPEKFGVGRLSFKVAILLTGSTLVALGAWYRCGTSWMTPVPRTEQLPTYFAKPCFYIFNFGVELLTVFLYAVMRVDLRFHVPNGAKGPGSYEMKVMPAPADEEQGDVGSANAAWGNKEVLSGSA